VKRHRELRHPVEWSARYRLPTTLEWRPCRLIDVSTAGAAIEPFAPLSFDALGSPVAVQFKLPGIDETFELHGDIRHTTRTSQGHVHLGIEFTNLTALDVRLLDLINRGLSLN
jgi:PilZ domain-containing protein